MDTHCLLEKIKQYISSDEFKNLEVKPLEYKSFKQNANVSQKQEKDPASELNIIKSRNKEDEIVADNIVMYFFDLPDDKFILCMRKINQWGFEIFFREFLMSYYLTFNKDNRLRYYVMKNFNRLSDLVKEKLDDSTNEAYGRFNFDNTLVNMQIASIKNDIKLKETAIASLQPKAYDETAPVADDEEEKLETSSKRDLRLAVFARLKQENPGLLD